MIVKVEPEIETKYRYVKQFPGSAPISQKIGCVIIAESESQYKIRITERNNYLQVGKLMWVKKYNVDYKPPKKEYDYSDAYWNK